MIRVRDPTKIAELFLDAAGRPGRAARALGLEVFRDRKSRHDGFERMLVDIGDPD
jgi:hypothetical protein